MVDRNSPEFIAAMAAMDRQAAHIDRSLDEFVKMARRWLRTDPPIEVMAQLSHAIFRSMDMPLTKGTSHIADSLAAAVIRLAQQQDLKVENETLTALLNDAQARNKQLTAELDDTSRSWFHRIFRTSKA